MKVLITGASGLIGRAVRKVLEATGHELLLAGRSEPKAGNEIKWTVDDGFADPGRLEGIDAVVHLAGESISGGLRWSEEKKRAIRDSRVLGTRNVVDVLAGLKRKPEVFIAGSAVGYYGDRGSEVLTEASPAGDTFLADVCQAWEAESRRAEDLGVRTAILRIGIVLSKDGGALGTMLTPFKLGVGGVVGGGDQYMSWVSLDDVADIIAFSLENEEVRGPVNVTAPEPVTNAEFTKTLGDVIHRPTILPLPGFAVNAIFGEMGDALLLASSRAVPQRLLDAGYEFKYKNLRPALEHAVE